MKITTYIPDSVSFCQFLAGKPALDLQITCSSTPADAFTNHACVFLTKIPISCIGEHFKAFATFHIAVADFNGIRGHNLGTQTHQKG